MNPRKAVASGGTFRTPFIVSALALAVLYAEWTINVAVDTGDVRALALEVTSGAALVAVPAVLWAVAVAARRSETPWRADARGRSVVRLLMVATAVVSGYDAVTAWRGRARPDALMVWTDRIGLGVAIVVGMLLLGAGRGSCTLARARVHALAVGVAAAGGPLGAAAPGNSAVSRASGAAAALALIGAAWRRRGRHVGPSAALVLVGLAGLGAEIGLSTVAFFSITELERAVTIVAGCGGAALLAAPWLLRSATRHEFLLWAAVLAPAGGAAWSVTYLTPVLRPGDVWLISGVLLAVGLGGLLSSAIGDGIDRRRLLAVMSLMTGACLALGAVSSGASQTAAVIAAAFFSSGWNLVITVLGERTREGARSATEARSRARFGAGRATALLVVGMITYAGAVRGAEATLLHVDGAHAALWFGAGASLLAAPALMLIPRTRPHNALPLRAALHEQATLLRGHRVIQLLAAVSLLNAADLLSWDAQHPRLLLHDGLAEYTAEFGLLFLLGAIGVLLLEPLARRRMGATLVWASQGNVIAWALVVPGLMLGVTTVFDDLVADALLELFTSLVTVVTIIVAQGAVTARRIAEATAIVTTAKAFGSIVGALVSHAGFGLADGRPWAGVIAAGLLVGCLQIAVARRLRMRLTRVSHTEG